jgi:predicted membrane protein
LISFAIFVFPVHGTILRAQHPALDPDTGTYALLATLAVAAISASVAANIHILERIGAVNTFSSASILAGAVLLAPILHPRRYIAIPLAAVYGLALGAMVSLHLLMLSTFLSSKEAGRWADDMPARVSIMLAVGGMCTFAGILVSAVVLERVESGSGMLLKIAGGCLVGGGVLVGLVRMYRWRDLGFAV